MGIPEFQKLVLSIKVLGKTEIFFLPDFKKPKHFLRSRNPSSEKFRCRFARTRPESFRKRSRLFPARVRKISTTMLRSFRPVRDPVPVLLSDQGQKPEMKIRTELFSVNCFCDIIFLNKSILIFFGCSHILITLVQ